MPKLSPLQTLPQHIAEAIAYYYTTSRRHFAYSRVTSEQDRIKDAWIVLNDVSFSWGVLALGYILGEVALELKPNILESGYVATRVSLPITESYIAVCPHVKAFEIKIFDTIEQPTARQLRDLGTVWPDNLVFPKARSLCISTYYRAKTLAVESADKDEYFCWIVQRIRTSFPNIRIIEIGFGYWGSSIRINAQELLSTPRNASMFLSAVFRKLRWRDTHGSACSANTNLAIQYSPKLTRISHSLPRHSEFIQQLVRRSTDTLESMEVGRGVDARFRHIFFHDDGHPLIFPRLKRLDLHVYDVDEEFERMGIPVAPFPELQRLGLNPSYLIADDTLFKNTSRTLKHLTISIDRETVGVLRKHKVFSNAKYSQLCCITVGETDKFNLKLPADDFMEFALSLVVPATRTLSISCTMAYQPLIDAIPTCLNAKNIRALTLRASPFNLLEAVNIIQCLPNMTHFVSSFAGLGPELRGIQGETVPGSLYASYYPLSHWFKYWDIVSVRNIPTEDMALSAITLAILCPGFICLDVPCNTKKYDGKLKSALDSSLYDAHAEKIKRLFYHDHFSVGR